MEIESCGWCDSSGIVECDCTGEIGPHAAEDDCPGCGGSGKHYCPSCHGTGERNYD